MRYIDLMGGKKPHIMRCHENGFGKKTEIEYKSSTWFYLQDKLKGEPWITKLAFPVQCVSKTIVSEAVTNVRFTAEYTYHHGYYDHAEREFRGFGRVEQTDTEYFDVFEKTGAGNTVPAEHHQPPVLTKTWFHTGAFLDIQRILTQFKKEYWQESFKVNGFTATAEFELPDAVLLAADNLIGLDLSELSADEWREALRACKGMLLRQEVFGLDAEKRTADEKQTKGYAVHDPALLLFQAAALQTELVPYSVATHNCEIQLLQGRDKNRFAVFMVKESESISYVYERDPEDPRITHTLTLESDELGNVLEAVSVVYPRLQEEDILKDAPTDSIVIRNAKEVARKGQQKQWVTFTKNEVTNDVIAPANYYLRKGWETKTYELTGVKPTKSFFTIADFKGKVKTFQEIKYQQKAMTGAQKRLIEHIKTKFYNADVSAPLPDGKLAIYAIPFEAYQLAYTPDLLADIFTPTALAAPMNVTDADMQAGKFLKDDQNWWIQSGTIHYRRAGENFSDVKDHFFAPVAYTDPFDSVTEVFYDPLHIFMQKSIDALGNESQVLRFNYRTLSPDIMRDINDNISSVVVDELGLVKAAAVEGKAGSNPEQGEEGDHLTGFTEQTEGTDVQNIIEFFSHARVPAPQICNSTLLHQNARKLLGNASARMVYDFSKQPTVVASIAREQHAKQNSNNSPVQISFEYSDGLGKVAMIKVQAEPGKIKSPDGTLLDSGDQLRWVGNGRTVLNNKGNPIRQYEPYFSTTPAYENDPDWVEQGVSPTLYYDGAGRNVKTELPNGTFTKVVFDAWKQYSHDVNDTVKDSDWHKQRMALGNSDPEKKAARQTEIHDNTPSCLLLDTLGRPTLGIEHNRWEDAPGSVKEAFYYTHSELDIEGNALSVTDARGNVVMRYRYDMLGHRVAQTSMDAGKRWMLNNALGNPVKAWDERQHAFSYEYDALHRPTKTLVKGGDGPTPLHHNYEKMIYGENQPNAKARNLRGKAAIMYDTAGKVSSESYDFKGNLLQSTRQLCHEYKTVPDWTTPESVGMEPEVFTSKSEYDALNRPVKIFTPHTAQIPASVISPEYNKANLLNAVSAKLRGSNNDTPFVKNIDYDAKGQRMAIMYGNNTVTRYTYDPATFRLLRLLTNRNTGAGMLQDLNYTYDPTGNITFIKDDALQSIFFNNNRVDPDCAYLYDSMYRLIQATGREHKAGNTAPDAYDAKRTNLPHKGDGNQLQTYTQRYQYDAAGNMLLMQNVNSWKRTFTYSPTNNQLLTAPANNEPGTPFTYTYDPHGNMSKMPHLPKMEWNFKDELQHIQINASNENDNASGAYYVYDAGGERIRKVVEKNNVIEERIYLGGFEIFRKRRNGTLELERETLHIMDDTRRIALIDTKIKANHTAELPLIRYQYSNHLGTASLELDGSDQAQIISYEEYYPYGSTSYQATDQVAEVPTKRYRYTGKERDEESGLEYHSARYYVPWLGRWVSCDPIGSVAGFNLYEYVHLNPIKFHDPNGNKEQSFGFLADALRKKDIEKQMVESKDLNDLKTRLGMPGSTNKTLGSYHIYKGFQAPAPDYNPDERDNVLAIRKTREGEEIVERVIIYTTPEGSVSKRERGTKAQLEERQDDANLQASIDMGKGLAQAAAGVGAGRASVSGVSNSIENNPGKPVAAEVRAAGNSQGKPASTGTSSPPPARQRVIDVSQMQISGTGTRSFRAVRHPSGLETVVETGVNERLVNVKANLSINTLGKGTDVTDAGRKFISKVGTKGDDSGHGLGSRLGGSGGVTFDNLFPQLSNVNRGQFSQWEGQIADWVKAGDSVSVDLKFTYGNDSRPTGIDYSVVRNGVEHSRHFGN